MKRDNFIKTRMARLALPALLATVGCQLITSRLPEPTDAAERIATFPQTLPLTRPARIYWNAAQVPFIEANSDTDLALLLGAVHAHLRLGQMELIRRIAQGRVAEMAGPLAIDIDHTLRMIGFARPAPTIYAELPAETRAFLDAYVRGINAVLEQLPDDELPHEFAALALDRSEPWTPLDVLAISRLAGADVNWLFWFRLLSFEGDPALLELRARFAEAGTRSRPSFQGSTARAPRVRTQPIADRRATERVRAQRRLLAWLLKGFSRSGSNSIALGQGRVAGSPAAIVSDPHLGILLPNIWLIAGYKSPNYHAVGLMIPGLPILGLGRNADIAWGGTNMRARSSDLYDVSHLPESALRSETVQIKVRAYPDVERTIRYVPDLANSPVLSDSPLLQAGQASRRIALRWVGHSTSDELTAFLKMQRAQSFTQFRAAFRTYAVSGQNFLYADREGNIGQLLAYRQPVRATQNLRDPAASLWLDPRDPAGRWQSFRSAVDLPAAYNPPGRWLASANNQPVRLKPPVSPFFGSSDRMERLEQLLAPANNRQGPFQLSELKAMQRDVQSPAALRLRDALLAWLDPDHTAPESPVREALREFDGQYRADSRGALALQLCAHALATRYYTGRYGADLAEWILSSEHAIDFLVADLADPAEAGALARHRTKALAEAERKLSANTNWGELHRVILQHPLGNLPLLGGAYRFADFAADGSATTLFKTAHPLRGERHSASYGANARHISLTGDPDANYFVLLGGQDGHLASPGLYDQVPLWRAGEYIQVPLRLRSVRAAFPYVTEFPAPGSRPVPMETNSRQ